MKKYLPQIILGLLAFIITFVYSKSFLGSIISSIVIIIISLVYHPQRRYFRAFWYVISLLFTTNLFFIQLIGTVETTSFIFKYEGFNIIQSIGLFILAIVLLILDFLERNKDAFFSNFKKRISHNIKQIHSGSGDNIAGDKIIKK